MKVTVLGSWHPQDAAQDPPLHHQGDFAGACRELGARIVRQGHLLIASSDEHDTADFHAVEGALAALKASPVAGQPIRLFGDRTSFFHWQAAAPQWITAEPSPEAEWKHAKLFQVKLSNCVVTVAGAEGTFHAGFAAAVADKLVVPVGSFGGASERLVHLFRQTYDRWAHLPSKDLLGQLAFMWSPYLAEQISTVIGVAGRPPRLAIIHGHSTDRDVLKDFLHNQMKLPEPVLMRNEFLSGKTLPEKWERLANDIDGAIAVVTPDDMGWSADAAGGVQDAQPRARENVWIELGWVWGRLGRERLLALRKGGTHIPSDLLGSDLPEYQSSPKEAQETIVKFVESIRQNL